MADKQQETESVSVAAELRRAAACQRVNVCVLKEFSVKSENPGVCVCVCDTT